jgi:hypothetical protein
MSSSDAAAFETAPRRSARARSSIVTHPWFAKMIGLWFAALLGMSSLALAPATLERIVTTLGIDRIVPATAPPLGQTAHLLLALGMAALGEIVGLLIGARLASRARRARDAGGDVPQLRGLDRHPDAPPRRPLSTQDISGEFPGDDTNLVEEAPSPRSAPPPRARVTAPRRPAIATAPLDTLGVAQLSERLALALAARRERRSVSAIGDPQSDAFELLVPLSNHDTLSTTATDAPVSDMSGDNDDLGESDRALRAALASLQRVSVTR